MNPEGQMKLEDSVKLVGLCNDMCPEFERVRRIAQKDYKRPECVCAPNNVEGAMLIRTRLQRLSTSTMQNGCLTNHEWSRPSLAPRQAWMWSWSSTFETLQRVW